MWPTDDTLDLLGVVLPLLRADRRIRLRKALHEGDPIIRAAVEIRDTYRDVGYDKAPVLCLGLIAMVNDAGL